MEKEFNHVAVRNLRKAEDNDAMADAVDSMPKSLDDYITSNREGSGLLQAYEELWRPIKNNMAKLSKPWKLAGLSKKELRRALESKAYAEEYYPTLEQFKNGSLFVLALQGMIAQARKAGFDPTILERWLANRDEKKIDVTEEEDDEISLEDLTAAFETTPATPAPTEGAEGATTESTEAPAPATDEAATEPTPEVEPTEENTAPEQPAQ